MKILAIYQGTAYFNFIESLNSEVTKTQYTYALKEFLNHNRLSCPDDILSIPLDSLEELIKRYLVYKLKEKKSPSHARTSLSALKHFCTMNKIKLDWNLLKPFQGKVKSKKYSTGDVDDAYTHDQIHKLLSICNLRQKAMVLIYASTGIRLAALPPLKLRHIKKIDTLYV